MLGMNQHLAGSIHGTTSTHDEFFVKFKKNLYKELILAWEIICLIHNVFRALFVGIILFIFEFPLAKEVASIIVPPVGIFLAGKYLTLLPMFIVIPLSIAAFVLPVEFIAPIIGIAAFFSLFIVFLA